METPTRPVPVNDLAHLEHTGPTPMEAWIRSAKLHDLYMPFGAALGMLIVALGAAVFVLAAVIVQRVTS